MEQYDQVIERMGLSRGGPGPAGALSHWVVATDTGILVTDLWKSRELYDAFARDQIGPYSAEAGIPEQPKITYYDSYNYLTQGADA
jgi:hypothetical protein